MSGLTSATYPTKLMVMENNNQIQQARDVLAKWRATPQPRLAMVNVMAQALDTESDARLIVGTAGNPDLLDAIDGLLELATDGGPAPATTRAYAGFIAAAIIAADERMTS